MIHSVWSGLVTTFSAPRKVKVGEPADPRFPAASLTSQRMDKVSSKSLGAVPFTRKPKTAAQVKARIQPKVRRAIDR